MSRLARSATAQPLRYGFAPAERPLAVAVAPVGGAFGVTGGGRVARGRPTGTLVCLPLRPLTVVTPASVTVDSGPSQAKVSHVSGQNSTQITWHSDQDFLHYQIRLVPSVLSDVTAGTQVESDQTPSGGGVSGTQYTDTILDSELSAAAAVEGTNILKIFVQGTSGTWST